MKPDSEKTHQDILKSAEKEFLEHGFSGASLRRIADGANVTTGALYRHFKDKDDLFQSLVSPVYASLLEQYESSGADYIRQLTGQGLDIMWDSSGDTMGELLQYVYAHYNIFRILIMASEQTPLEDFTHRLVEMNVEVTAAYLKKARELGYAVNEISREELHVLINGQFSCIFEMLKHDTPKDTALAYAKNLSKFYTGGWKALILK